jgi:RNA-directed DNA polymerase
MKESYVEGIATHDGPESCAAARKGSCEALTGVRAGRVSSREMDLLRDADAVRRGGKQNRAHRYREMRPSLARSETPGTYGNTSHENREVLCPPAADGAAGRAGKSKDARWR